MTRNTSHTVVGSDVHATATFILAGAEAQRRYGSLWDTKTLAGVVEKVRKVKGKTKSDRVIDAAWAVGSIKVRKSLILLDIKPGSVPVPTGPNQQPDFIRREPSLHRQSRQHTRPHPLMSYPTILPRHNYALPFDHLQPIMCKGT